MRVFILTVARRRLLGGRRMSPVIERRIEDALNRTPWRSDLTTRSETWVSPSRAVRVDVTTNEPATTGPLIHRHPEGRAATWTGHIDDPTFTGATLDPGTVAGLPGCFALATVDNDTASGYTAIHRMEQLYLAEGKDAFVLSTSARAAHRVAGVRDDSPPLEALIGLSGPGFMVSDLTPFPGVRAVPAATRVTLSPSGLGGQSLPPADIDPDAPLDELAKAVADALLVAASTMGRSSWTKTVQLTGGKDSRLAAAVLTAAGVDFTAVTTGLETHPDVVVARRVASLLGIRHHVLPPAGAVAGGDRVEVRPMSRAYHALRGCDGMLTCYETLNVNARYDDTSVTLGGHGGELLRGGFAYGFPPSRPAALERRLDQRVGPHRQMLTPAARDRLDQMVAPWRQLILAEPDRGSEIFYRVVRSGRWHAVARGVYQIRGPRRSILADNRVVRLVSAVRQDLAAEERLVHAVMHQLRPDLCSVPLFAKRWNFEKSGPGADCDPQRWADREPPPDGRRQAWNWKVSYPAELHRHLADAILAAPLYDALLDREQVEQFLAQTVETRTGPQAQLTWSLFTTAQLVTGLGSAASEPDGPLVTIPLPGQAQPG